MAPAQGHAGFPLSWGPQTQTPPEHVVLNPLHWLATEQQPPTVNCGIPAATGQVHIPDGSGRGMLIGQQVFCLAPVESV
jgi:hypothetical protein